MSKILVMGNFDYENLIKYSFNNNEIIRFCRYSFSDNEITMFCKYSLIYFWNPWKINEGCELSQQGNLLENSPVSC